MNYEPYLAEYNMLRQDIQQRISFRFRLFSLLLVSLAALLPLGIEQVNSNILFAYPILSLFLILSWMHQSTIMIKIARYLRDELEPKVDGLNWEAFILRDSKRLSSFSLFGFFATAGFVLFSQGLMLTLGFLIQDESTDGAWNIVMQVVSIAASALTFLFLIVYRQMKR